MTTDIDFDNPDFREILDSIQSGAAGLQTVALLDTETGRLLCSDESIRSHSGDWLPLAQYLFARPSENPWTPSRSIHHCLLHFDNDSLGIVRGAYADGAHLAAVLPASRSMGGAIDTLKQVLAELEQAPTSAKHTLLRVDASGVTVTGASATSDTASSLCADSDVVQSLVLGLLGASPMQTLSRLLDTTQQPSGSLKQAYIHDEQQGMLCQRLRFLPHSVLAMISTDDIAPAALSALAQTASDAVLRKVIDGMLKSGWSADTELPKTDQDWQGVVNELRRLDPDDLIAHLTVGGFADHSLGDAGEMEDGAMVLRCKECIYYLPNRKWCDLPELPVPVEPHWYCRLWRL